MPRYDVADRIDSGLGGFHPAVGFDEAAIGLDVRLLESDVVGARFAAYGDQNFIGFDLLWLAIYRKGHGDSGLRLLDLLDLGSGMKIDAALAIHAGQFLGDVFVFDGNQPRQHFENGDFGVEGAEDRGELHAYGAGADNHQGFRNFFQTENLDVGKDLRIRREAGNHAGFGAGGQNDVLRLDLAALAIGGHFDGENAILAGTGEFSVALDGLDLILAHQEFEAFGVLGDDLGLALLNRSPIQFAGIYALDAEFLGIFQVIPYLGVKQQRLGRDAADVQAGSAEKTIFFDQGGFQAVLSGADGSGVTGRAAADDCDVINSFGQGDAPW